MTNNTEEVSLSDKLAEMAEYMGYELSDGKIFATKNLYREKVSELKYNTSFNDLVPVWSKIYKELNGNIEFEIAKISLSWHIGHNDIKSAFDTVYAALQFLKEIKSKSLPNPDTQPERK